MSASRDARTRRVMTASWMGSASGPMKSSHWQCGALSTGTHGGRIGGDGGGVERRVLDGVTHRADGGLAVLLDLEQGPAAPEPEGPAALVLEPVAHVHVLVRKPYVELEALEDRADVVALEAEAAPHPASVDRARAHPLLDRDRLARGRPELHVYVGQRAAVQEMAEEHVLAAEGGELAAGELVGVDHGSR